MKRVVPAIVLFFLAPLVAEYLLGDIPLNMIIALIFMAPMYGGGALVIREVARRTGHGWATILTLALAYGIFEEAFMTETLFNPNYMGLNLHLLQPGFIPMFGIGAWWTVFVITLHTVWSISTSIGLTEAMFPDRATQPWLKMPGLSLIGLLFVVIAVFASIWAVKTDKAHFVASTHQFIVAGCIGLLVVVAAFLIPKPNKNISRRGTAPSAWIVGLIALAECSIFLIVPQPWGWRAVGIYALLYIIAIALFFEWSQRAGWGSLHRLALAGGAALSYAWHAFFQNPVTGAANEWFRIGNAILALATILYLAAAARRDAAFEKAQRAAGV